MLTDAKCRNATSEGNKLRKLADGGGLYLWVHADGRKYWRLRYYMAGKEKTLSLGVYPKVSLKDARAKRDTERKRLNDNLDPSAERRAEKMRVRIAAENSFEAVAREWFGMQLHTCADVKRRLEKNVFPFIGRRPIAQVDAPELLEAVRKIEARDSYDLAHRVLQVCGQVFRYGVATGRCTRDIVPDLRGALTPHKAKHQAAIKPEELPDLLRAIAGYDQLGDKQTRLALQLLALTFVRTNELIGAEWSEFEASGLGTVPGARVVPGSPSARAGGVDMRTEHCLRDEESHYRTMRA